MARLLAAGDLDAARVAHDAMERLLGAATPATGSPPVVDLAAEREHRGR
ncbi:MAG: hypothetical protein QM820_22545 [Minicystis sp.]